LRLTAPQEIAAGMANTANSSKTRFIPLAA
jgi:hypothetical protein